MFLAVTIDIYVLFLIPSEAKFKERNELMIGKEVTLTFSLSLSETEWETKRITFILSINFSLKGKVFRVRLFHMHHVTKYTPAKT